MLPQVSSIFSLRADIFNSGAMSLCSIHPIMLLSDLNVIYLVPKLKNIAFLHSLRFLRPLIQSKFLSLETWKTVRFNCSKSF